MRSAFRVARAGTRVNKEAGAVEDMVETEEFGALTLKGLLKPVSAFNVVALKSDA